MKNKKLFKKLSQEYTNEELVESFVFPHGLSAEEKAKADEELQTYRFQRLRETTKEQRLLADLVQLRIRMEDYIKKEPYQKNKSFGHFLQQYLKIIDKKRKEFAKDLGVHYTKLSRLLNDKETPNLDVLYRIEIHAGQLISALLWWKLLIKKMEVDIKENKKARIDAAKKVENQLILNR